MSRPKELKYTLKSQKLLAASNRELRLPFIVMTHLPKYLEHHWVRFEVLSLPWNWTKFIPDVLLKIVELLRAKSYSNVCVLNQIFFQKGIVSVFAIELFYKTKVGQGTIRKEYFLLGVLSKFSCHRIEQWAQVIPQIHDRLTLVNIVIDTQKLEWIQDFRN